MKKLIKKYFKGDKMGIKEPLNVPKKVTLTKSEAEWLEIQSTAECISENSIFRRALKLYKQETVTE